MMSDLWVYKIHPDDELHDAYTLHACRPGKTVFRGIGRHHAFIVIKGPVNPANLYPRVNS